MTLTSSLAVSQYGCMGGSAEAEAEAEAGFSAAMGGCRGGVFGDIQNLQQSGAMSYH
jgi:hypothetical protein